MAGTKPVVTRVAAVLIALGVVAVFVAGSGERKPQGPERAAASEYAGPEPPAAQDVIALLDGLKQGDRLGKAVVLAIDAPADGVVSVDFGIGNAAFSVGVGAKGSSGGKPPPITTEKYEIGYGHARGEGKLDAVAARAAADAIAERVRRRELAVPTPHGM